MTSPQALRRLAVLALLVLAAGPALSQQQHAVSPRLALSPGDNNDPDTVSDSASQPGADDFGDLMLLPNVLHSVQHFEWLGRFVDEEFNTPSNDHTVGHPLDDDGLIALSWTGAQVTVRARVRTNFTAHPVAFPNGSKNHIDAWIDWDKDATFEHPAEHVGTLALTPPFGGFLGPDSAVVNLIGPAAAGPGSDYHVRLRLDWHDANNPHVSAPGGEADGNTSPPSFLPLESFGEVEDYRATDPWYARSHGSFGSNGAQSHLTGSGNGIAGNMQQLDLEWAKPNAPVSLVVGLTRLEIPFKGAILCPAPDFIAPLATNGAGAFTLPFVLDSAVPAGIKIYLQAWVTDPAANFGLAASNGLRLLTK